jgi:hypothetical protein
MITVEDVSLMPNAQAKEELLQTLLNFTDNCGGFYHYRVYFLAAEGVIQ